jgi:hypothetical protein
MEKRSDRTGILIELSFVVVHFKSWDTKECRASHNAFSGVLANGVKKTCKPGETRDVNGGVAV